LTTNETSIHSHNHTLEVNVHQSKERELLAFERMLFFSDAVFAISITLLILEIKVPPIQQEFSELQLWYALLQLTPKIVGFLISFFLIGQHGLNIIECVVFWNTIIPGCCGETCWYSCLSCSCRLQQH